MILIFPMSGITLNENVVYVRFGVYSDIQQRIEAAKRLFINSKD
jgi:hypothetical protein